MVVDDDVEEDVEDVVDVDVAVLARMVVRARLAGVSDGQLMEMDQSASCIWPDPDSEPLPLPLPLPGLRVSPGAVVGRVGPDPCPDPDEPEPLPSPLELACGRRLGIKITHFPSDVLLLTLPLALAEPEALSEALSLPEPDPLSELLGVVSDSLCRFCGGLNWQQPVLP